MNATSSTGVFGSRTAGSTGVSSVTSASDSASAYIRSSSSASVNGSNLTATAVPWVNSSRTVDNATANVNGSSVSAPDSGGWASLSDGSDVILLVIGAFAVGMASIVLLSALWIKFRKRQRRIARANKRRYARANAVDVATLYPDDRIFEIGTA